jgi:hypothetical protein
MIPAKEALQRLRDGNRRFVARVRGGATVETRPLELEELEGPARSTSPNLRAIVDRVRPAVEPLLATELRRDPAALVGAEYSLESGVVDFFDGVPDGA